MFLNISKKIKTYLNSGNYPKNSKYYKNANNLVLGKMKHETCGGPIKDFVVGKMKHETCGEPVKDFVGLKSKMNTFIPEDNHESERVKGIIKNIADD